MNIYTRNSPAYITVTNSTFLAPRTAISIHGYGYSSGTSSCAISSNAFYTSGNSYSGYYLVYMSRTSCHEIDISKNTFTAHSDITAAVYIRTNSRSFTHEENEWMKISENTFQGLQATYIVDMDNGNYMPITSFTGNYLANNTANAVLRCASPSTTIINNYFENPSSDFELQVTSKYEAARPVYATKNWWGSTDVAIRIYDYGHDSSLSKVIYEPYYVTSDRSMLNQIGHKFFRTELEIGGEVTEDVVLNNATHAYEVVEEIIIPFGRKLTLGPGVTLKFRTGGLTSMGKCSSSYISCTLVLHVKKSSHFFFCSLSFFSIQGTLLILGEESAPVMLEPAENSEDWKGIEIKTYYTGMLYNSRTNITKITIMIEV